MTLITDPSNEPMFTLDRKLWLADDRATVIEDGQAGAAFLLGLEGDEITLAEAERLGLVKSKRATKQEAAPEDKQAAEPEDKAVKKAPAKKRAAKKA